MAVFKVYHKAKGNIGGGRIDLDTHTFNAILSNTQPDQDNDQYRADAAELGAGNGYSLGGVALGSITWVEAAGSPSGYWQFDSANFSFTASGGSIGPAQYIIVFCNSAVGSPGEYLLGFLDYGAPFTITDGNSLNVTVSNGFFQLFGG